MTLPLFFLVGILGGTTGSLIKYAGQEVPGVMLVAIRFALALFILLPFMLKNGFDLPKSKRNLIFISSAAFGINVLLFAAGIQYTSAIMGQIIYVPSSILVAIAGYIFLKEKLSLHQVLGLALTISGLFVLALGSLKTGDIHNFGKPEGNFLIFIALFFWVTYLVTSRKVVKDYSPVSVAFYNTAIALLVSLFVLPIEAKGTVYNFTQWSFPTWLSLVGCAISSSVFIFLYQRFLKTTSAFVASLVNYVNPIAASLIGITLFDETLTLSLVLGALIICAGVFMATSFGYIKSRVGKK